MISISDERPNGATLASFYAGERGWRVLPCYSFREGKCTCGRSDCPNPGKHPHTVRGVRDASCDPGKTEAHWTKWPDANVAIATGSGLAVVDVDPRNGGFETLKWLEAKFGALPREFVVATGGGGLHIYCAVPTGLKSCKKWASQGVEILCEGLYVVAPPSTHPSGETYRWLHALSSGPLPALPSQWISQLPKIEPAEAKGTKSVRRRSTNQTDSITTIPSYLSDYGWDAEVCRRVEAAVRLSTVTTSGSRNHQLLQLGRRLGAIEAVQDMIAELLKPIVQEWHRRSKPFMRTKEWGVSWGEWLNIWGVWIDPARCSDSAVTYALKSGENGVMPICAMQYRSQSMRKLVAVCKALHDESDLDGGVFFLSCRTVASLLGITVYHANSWLNRLVRDGILEKANLHKPGSLKAQRYRYTGDEPTAASQAA